MDPLTFGFEQAFYEANRAERLEAGAAARLAAALEVVIGASPHRVRRLVSVAVIDDAHIELRRGAEVRHLVRARDRWQWEASGDPSWSGVVAAALTDWLVS